MAEQNTISIKTLINNVMRKQRYAKFNTSDTTLTRILHVATLYFNRILHILFKGRRQLRNSNCSQNLFLYLN